MSRRLETIFEIHVDVEMWSCVETSRAAAGRLPLRIQTPGINGEHCAVNHGSGRFSQCGILLILTSDSEPLPILTTTDGVSI